MEGWDDGEYAAVHDFESDDRADARADKEYLASLDPDPDHGKWATELHAYYFPAKGDEQNHGEGESWRAIDLFRANLEVPQGLVADRHLTPKTVSLFLGPGGVGKTYVLLKLAAAIAAGEPFGFYTTRQAAVLFLSEEMSAEEMVERLRDIFSEEQLERIADRLTIVCDSGVRCDSEEGRDELRETIERNGAPGLVVIDALSDVRGSFREDSNDDMGALFKGLRDEVARPLSTHLCVIHHTGKASDDRTGADKGRGASIMRDICVPVLSLSVVGKDRRRLAWEKTRHGNPPPAVVLDFVTGEGGRWEVSFGKASSDPAPADPKLVEVRDALASITLPASWKASVSAIRSKTGLQKTAAEDRLQAAVEAGLVVHKGESYEFPSEKE